MADDLEIVVDERERQSGLISGLKSHEDVQTVNAEMLDVGDVIVGGESGDVVFERKTPNDFVGSIQNRRLENQIQDMYDIFGPENSYVIIEGNMDDFDKLKYTAFSAKSARGYVGSICARWQCIPLFASDMDRLIDSITRVSRKHFESTDRVVRRPQDSPDSSTDDFFARTVLQLEGVGKSKIEPLRNRFDSVYELSHANKNSLTAIDGIGDKTAESIIDQFWNDD